MTICPIAVVSSCKSCPVFKVCPAKSIIEYHNKEKDQAGKEENATKK